MHKTEITIDESTGFIKGYKSITEGPSVNCSEVVDFAGTLVFFLQGFVTSLSKLSSVSSTETKLE